MTADVESVRGIEHEGSEKHDAKDSGLLSEFASNTTLHGVHYVAGPHMLVRRIAWAILMIAGAGVLISQCIERYQKLSSKEFFTVKEQQRNKLVPFPAVTICNQNMLRREKIIGTEAQTFLDNLEILYSKGKLRNHTNKIFNLNLDKVARETGHNISDMLLDCNFQQESCSSKEFSTAVFPRRGLCYTFNSGKPGYPLHFVTAGGRVNALVLFLMAQPTQYYGPYSTDTTGFRVLVHDQNYWPDVENHGIDLSPGFLTTIPIQRHKIFRLPSPYKSNCGEKQLQFVQYYSRSACLFECLTRTVVDKCHCRLLGTVPSGKLNATRYCGPTEIVSCAEVIQGDLLVNSTSCECPLECTTVSYEVQVFSSTFPSKTYNTTASFKKFMLSSERRLDGAADNFEKTIRENVAQVKIFYKTTITDISRETPAYDINDFGADIGGSMGLFLGCSLLTLCEFVDLFLMFCLTRFSFRRRVLQVSQ